jgi:hypothetical protein
MTRVGEASHAALPLRFCFSVHRKSIRSDLPYLLRQRRDGALPQVAEDFTFYITGA